MSNQSVFLLVWANRAVNRRETRDEWMFSVMMPARSLRMFTWHRYIARSYKQNGKTWYEQRGGKRSAELFRKHPQTIVSNSSRKIAEAISAVRLEGSISWVVQVPLLCLVLRGIFSSGLEMEYRACLFCLQMAVGWSQRARGQNSHSEWSWPVGGAIWKIGCSSIGRNEKFHI